MLKGNGMSFQLKFRQSLLLTLACFAAATIFVEALFALSRPMTGTVIIDGLGLGAMLGIGLAFAVHIYRYRSSNPGSPSH